MIGPEILLLKIIAVVVAAVCAYLVLCGGLPIWSSPIASGLPSLARKCWVAATSRLVESGRSASIWTMRSSAGS